MTTSISMKPYTQVFPVKLSKISSQVLSTFVNCNYLLFFMMMSIGIDQAHAREWFATSQISSRLIFDSNYLLRTNAASPDPNDTRIIKPKDTIGGTLSAGGTIGSQTENSDIHVQGNVNFNRFNIDNFNSTDVFLYPEAWFTVSPRNKLGISGTLFFDTTLAREIAGNGTNVQDSSDSDDLFGIAKRRFKKSIKPEWNHSLTEKTNLNLSYEFTDVTYQDAESTGRTDYSIHSGQLSLSYQLTENTSIFVIPSTTLFSTPDADSSTTYYSLQAGIQHKFSERWEAEIVAGGRYSRSEFNKRRTNKDIDGNPVPVFNTGGQIIDKDHSSGLGSLANASITHHYTTGSIEASIGQDIRPTGNGDLQTSNEAALTWTHQLSEHLDFSLPASFLRAEAINSDSDRLDRTYYQVAPRLNWRLTPELSMALSYRYRYQKYKVLTGSANSHNAMLSVTYHWQRFSISR
jgi:hypothetical protein